MSSLFLRVVDEKEEVRLRAHRKTVSKAIAKERFSVFVRTLLFSSLLLLLVRLRRRLSRAFQSLDFSRLFKPFRDVWEKRERNELILTHHCFPFASSSTETHSDFRAFRERALSVNLPHKRIKRPS